MRTQERQREECTSRNLFEGIMISGNDVAREREGEGERGRERDTEMGEKWEAPSIPISSPLPQYENAAQTRSKSETRPKTRSIHAFNQHAKRCPNAAYNAERDLVELVPEGPIIPIIT